MAKDLFHFVENFIDSVYTLVCVILFLGISLLEKDYNGKKWIFVPCCLHNFACQARLQLQDTVIVFALDWLAAQQTCGNS